MAGVEEIDFRHIFPGGRQQFLRLVQVIGVSRQGFILAPHALRQGIRELFAPAFHGTVDDGIVIDGIGQGLPEFLIAGGKFLVIQVHNGAEKGRIFIDMDGLIVLQLVDLVHGNALSDVDIPLLQLQPLGGGILDAVENDMLNGGRLAGIIFLYVQFDGLGRRVGRDLIGTGAHGVGSQIGGSHVVIPGLVHDLRIHDGRPVHCQGIEERSKGLGQLEYHRLIIGSFDGVHHLEIVRWSFLHLFHPVNGKLHRLRIHRGAVSKLMALLQGKGPGEAIVTDGPGLGQGRFHVGGGLAVFHLVLHQPFIGRIGDLPSLVIHGDSGVQGFRIHRHPHYDGILRHRTAAGRTSG